jgi:hypothetical protein
MTDGVKFVRIHGRVVPLKGKGSAPAGVSKRYGAKRENPKVKSLGAGKGAVIGVLSGLAATWKQRSIKSAAIGVGLFALAGAGLGASIKSTKKGKGESDEQASRRVAGIVNHKKKHRTGV